MPVKSYLQLDKDGIAVVRTALHGGLELRDLLLDIASSIHRK